MSDQPSARLRVAVRQLGARVRTLREQYRDGGLGEGNTKAALIDSLLQALGWATHDPSSVGQFGIEDVHGRLEWEIQECRLRLRGRSRSGASEEELFFPCSWWAW
jgi:hypothetical protein